MTGYPISSAISRASTSSLHAAFGSRDTREPEPLGGALGLDLVAHQADVFGLRADECDLVLVENIRETRVLGQKAVARMNGVSACDLARSDNRGNVEIAVARRRLARCIRFHRPA